MESATGPQESANAVRPDLTFPHPISFSADPVVPIKDGGHNDGELRAAHLCHNRARNRKTKPLVRHGSRL